MTEAEKLILTDKLFLGRGAHKATYIHPKQASLCVKVPYQLPDTDVDREIEYRKVLDRKGFQSHMLTKYYGTVDTSLGLGYIYEHVQDYDGRTSISLKEAFLVEGELKQRVGASLYEVLACFKELWFAENIVTSDMDYANFYIQMISPTEFTIRIIDNIGTPNHLPLAYYFQYFAKKRARRYWMRFLKCYHEKHPDILTDEIMNKVLGDTK